MHIMTAAHCMKFPNEPTAYSIQAGDVDLFGNLEMITVRDIYIHPRRVVGIKNTTHNDLAVLTVFFINKFCHFFVIPLKSNKISQF